MCVDPRPDLGSAFIFIEPESTLAPEELFTLSMWLRESWRRQAGSESLDFEANACEGAFLCAAVDPHAASSALASLVQVLSQDQSASFYAVRTPLLEQVGELSRTDASWKLRTAAHALLTERGALRGNPLFVTPEAPAAAAREAIIEREVGVARVTRLGIADAKRLLEGLMPAMSLVAVGPGLSKATMTAATAHVAATSKAAAPAPVGPGAAPPSANPPIYPLILTQHVGEATHGAFLTQPKLATGVRELTAVLRVLAKRAEEKSPTTRIRVELARGNYSVPAVRVDGAYDDVLAAMDTLDEEFDRLLSASGRPSLAEWSRATLAGTPPRLTVRCTTRFESPDLSHALDALRAGPRPVAVVWGTAEERSTDEAP